MTEIDTATPTQIDRLQEVLPVWQLQGHEVCADVHLALTVAHAVLSSRRDRVADLPDTDSGDALLRELRALGVQEASPQTLAMVALVESAVVRLAAAGGLSQDEAWEQLHGDVLARHCASSMRTANSVAR